MKDDSKLRLSVATVEATYDVKGKKKAVKKRSLHASRPPINEILNSALMDCINELRSKRVSVRVNFHDQEQNVRVQGGCLRTVAHCKQS